MWKSFFDRISLIFIIALITWLSACTAQSPAVLDTLAPTVEPTWTPIIVPTFTATALPTATDLPTQTPLPPPTFTPTPVLFALPGTALPSPAPINLESAARVSALAEWRLAEVTDMAWLPDSRFLAVADQRTIHLYELATRENLRTLYPQVEGTVSIAFSPDGVWLVSGSRRGSLEEGFFSTLELWFGPDWKPLGILYDVPLALSRISFSPNNQAFATAFSSPVYENNRVAIWSSVTWQIIDTLSTGTALDTAFSPDGRLLALTPDRYAVQVWSFEDETWILKFHTSFTGSVTRLAFSPDGVTLATGHYDGEIQLWNLQTGERLLTIRSEEVIEDLAFSPDGLLLASGGSFQNNLVRLWSVSDGSLLRVLDGHTNGITRVLFSPDGQYLVSASYEGLVRLWGLRP